MRGVPAHAEFGVVELPRYALIVATPCGGAVLVTLKELYGMPLVYTALHEPSVLSEKRYLLARERSMSVCVCECECECNV